jgi:hypothetical protein
MGVNVGGHGVLDRGVTGGGGGAHVFCDEVKHYRCKQLTLQPRTPGTYNGEPPTPLLPPSPLETGPPFSGEGVPVSCLLCPIADPSPAPLPPPSHTVRPPTHASCLRHADGLSRPAATLPWYSCSRVCSGRGNPWVGPSAMQNSLAAHRNSVQVIVFE